MKFVYALTILFAFVFAVEAYELDIELQTINPIQNLTVGKVTLTLIGKTTSKEVVFEEKNIKTYIELTLLTDFPETVDSIKINWQGETENKPLIFTWCRIRADRYTIFQYNLEGVYIQSGETKEFKRLVH